MLDSISESLPKSGMVIQYEYQLFMKDREIEEYKSDIIRLSKEVKTLKATVSSKEFLIEELLKSTPKKEKIGICKTQSSIEVVTKFNDNLSLLKLKIDSLEENLGNSSST